MKKPDKRIKRTVQILTIGIVLLTVCMLGLWVMNRFELGSVNNNFSEFIYLVFYYTLFISFYISAIALLVLVYLLIAKRKAKIG